MRTIRYIYRRCVEEGTLYKSNLDFPEWPFQTSRTDLSSARVKIGIHNRRSPSPMKAAAARLCSASRDPRSKETFQWPLPSLLPSLPSMASAAFCSVMRPWSNWRTPRTDGSNRDDDGLNGSKQEAFEGRQYPVRLCLYCKIELFRSEAAGETAELWCVPVCQDSLTI